MQPEHDDAHVVPRLNPKILVQGHLQCDMRDRGEVVVETVPGVDDDGDQRADPHEAVAEEGRQYAGLQPVHHVEWKLDQWEDEVLVLHPLAPEHRAHAGHQEQHDRCQRGPGDDRREPGIPGDRLTRVQALEEIQGSAGIRRRNPVGHEMEEGRLPLVLDCGEVAHAGESGEEVLGEAEGRDAAAHQHHRVDGQQLAGLQRELPHKQPQGGVDHHNEQELDDEDTDGQVAGGNPRSLQLKVAVGNQQPENADAHKPDDDRAYRDAVHGWGPRR